MKKGKVNPFDVFEARRVNFCPSHFESVVIHPRYNLAEAIKHWIDENTSGRYYIGKALNLTSGPTANTITTCTRVAFEKESELSYFMLACPHLKYN